MLVHLCIRAGFVIGPAMLNLQVNKINRIYLNDRYIHEQIISVTCKYNCSNTILAGCYLLCSSVFCVLPFVGCCLCVAVCLLLFRCCLLRSGAACVIGVKAVVETHQ